MGATVLHREGRARAGAYALDALGYLGIAVATVPVGVLLRRSVLEDPSPGTVMAISAVPPVLATCWAAAAESGPTGATGGKRRLGLCVEDVDGGSPPSFTRALLRNTVKIALPWQLGHMVAVGAAFGGFETRDPLTLGATAVLYPVMGVLVGQVLLGSGRGPHDRLAGTRVRRIPSPSAAGPSPADAHHPR